MARRPQASSTTQRTVDTGFGQSMGALTAVLLTALMGTTLVAAGVGDTIACSVKNSVGTVLGEDASDCGPPNEPAAEAATLPTPQATGLFRAPANSPKVFAASPGASTSTGTSTVNPSVAAEQLRQSIWAQLTSSPTSTALVKPTISTRNSLFGTPAIRAPYLTESDAPRADIGAWHQKFVETVGAFDDLLDESESAIVPPIIVNEDLRIWLRYWQLATFQMLTANRTGPPLTAEERSKLQWMQSELIARSVAWERATGLDYDGDNDDSDFPPPLVTKPTCPSSSTPTPTTIRYVGC